MSRASLAASFVVIVSGGCKPTEPDIGTSPPSIFQDTDGICRYTFGMSCPEGASCNPPAPVEVECPPDMRGGPPAEGPVRADKVRVKEKLRTYQGDCNYASDFFCALPPTSGCDTQQSRKVACRELGPGTSPVIHHIESFIAKRADGSCTRYPAFTCMDECKLPAGEAVSCALPDPPASFAPQGQAPLPFTLAQIREATKAGRRYVWRVEQDDNPPETTINVFTIVDDEGVTMISGENEAALSEGIPNRITWQELMDHGSFLAERTSIQRERITVPAGTFDCNVYTIKAGGWVQRLYFARELPGAPVLHYVEKNGRPMVTTTLLSHSPGGSASVRVP